MALTTEIYFLTVLGAGSPRSRCWQSWLLLSSLSLACRWPPSHCVLTWSSLCTCIPDVSSSSYNNTSHLGLELPMVSFYLSYFFKGSFIVQSHSEILGIRVSTYGFWGLSGGTIQFLPANSIRRINTKRWNSARGPWVEWRLRQRQWREQTDGRMDGQMDGCCSQQRARQREVRKHLSTMTSSLPWSGPLRMFLCACVSLFRRPHGMKKNL